MSEWPFENSSSTEEIQKFQSRIEKILEKNEKIQILQKELGKNRFKLTDFHLFNCSKSSKLSGGFSPDLGIAICMDQIFDDVHLTDTLIHELLHAYDYHTIKYDWKNCYHFTCAEIRAANLSGDCNFIREFLRGNWNLKGQQLKCVKRRTELALKMNPICGNLDSKELIDHVWDFCINDLAPFDENII